MNQIFGKIKEEDGKIIYGSLHPLIHIKAPKTL